MANYVKLAKDKTSNFYQSKPVSEWIELNKIHYLPYLSLISFTQEKSTVLKCTYIGIFLPMSSKIHFNHIYFNLIAWKLSNDQIEYVFICHSAVL